MGTKADWIAAKASAAKILGKEAEFPKPRVDPLKAIEEVGKPFDTLFKLLDSMESAIVECQTGYGKVSAACKQYADMLEGSDFGLDTKKPEDKKKIDAALKVLIQALEAMEAHGDNGSKVLSNLDKTLASLAKDVKEA
jgi:hypothetical protein